jgi:hypothetical protein
LVKNACRYRKWIRLAVSTHQELPDIEASQRAPHIGEPVVRRNR